MIYDLDGVVSKAEDVRHGLLAETAPDAQLLVNDRLEVGFSHDPKLMMRVLGGQRGLWELTLEFFLLSYKDCSRTFGVLRPLRRKVW